MKNMNPMKRYISILVMVAASLVLLTACKDKAAEKRIAELEGRLAQLETSKAATPTATPAAEVPTTAEVKPEGPLPEMVFETMDHDFGTIHEGQKVVHVYKLKNTGQAPLVIQGAVPSCGCTAPDWTKTPIPVGGSGFVRAEFDSEAKPGINNKTITVTTNAWPKATTLRFKAMVTPKTEMKGPTK